MLNNDDFRAWRDPGSAMSLLWIHGGAGMGKTMLICGILDVLRPQTQPQHAANGNLAFFFCERGNDKTRSAEAVLRGLLFMLATDPRRPSVIKHIRDKHNDAGPGIFEGHNAWWSLEPLLDKALGEVGGQRRKGAQVTYLVIDALDECEIRLELLLELIAKSSSTAATRVKWLVTSRGTDSIRRRLGVSRAGPGRGLDLDDHAAELSTAVEHYIHQRVLALVETRSEDDHLLYQQIRAELERNRATRGFLHVALVVRKLRGMEPGERLCELNKLAVDVKGLYRQTEERIRSLSGKTGPVGFCQRALSAVAVAYRPLREQELRALAGMGSPESEQTETAALGLCDSFFVMGNGEANFIHESAREYLQQDSVLFTPGLRTEHHRLFSASLKVMGTMLRRDNIMDDLSHPDCPTTCTTQQDGETGRRPTPAAAEYACDYWIEHLVAGGQHDHDTRDGGVLLSFLQSRFLCWLEYLARRGRMRGVLSSWAKLAGFLEVSRYQKKLGFCLMQYHTNSLPFVPPGQTRNEPASWYSCRCAALHHTPRADHHGGPGPGVHLGTRVRPNRQPGEGDVLERGATMGRHQPRHGTTELESLAADCRYWWLPLEPRQDDFLI